MKKEMMIQNEITDMTVFADNAKYDKRTNMIWLYRNDSIIGMVSMRSSIMKYKYRLSDGTFMYTIKEVQ